MKICLVIHSLGIGGMERVMALLANYFSELSNVTVHLILIGKKRDIQYEISDTIVVHRPNFTFDDSKRQWHTLKTMKFLRKTVKQVNPSTVLSFGEIWNNLVILALIGTGYPLYVSDRCKADKSLGKIHDALRKWLYKNVEGIIAQTKYAKDFFTDLTGHSKMKVIGNPIRFIDSSFDDKKKVILTVGRLINTKHHDRLIQLFTEIRKPEWELVIVGGNSLKQNNKQKLESLVKELNAEKFIHIEGEQNNVDYYYRNASIFAFTSSSEGFPNVIGEALSAGLPVVAYDCVSGPSDLIDSGKNGYLLDVFNDEKFKKHLIELMENKEFRMKMAKEAVTSIQYYNKENIGQKFFQFITSHL